MPDAKGQAEEPAATAVERKKMKLCTPYCADQREAGSTTPHPGKRQTSEIEIHEAKWESTSNYYLLELLFLSKPRSGQRKFTMMAGCLEFSLKWYSKLAYLCPEFSLE
jgi:hypothetical protein